MRWSKTKGSVYSFSDDDKWRIEVLKPRGCKLYRRYPDGRAGWQAVVTAQTFRPRVFPTQKDAKAYAAEHHQK